MNGTDKSVCIPVLGTLVLPLALSRYLASITLQYFSLSLYRVIRFNSCGEDIAWINTGSGM